MKISHWIEMGSQVRNQEGGGEAPPRKMFDMKSIGHSVKNLGPSQNSWPTLVSQTGYGPVGSDAGKM